MLTVDLLRTQILEFFITCEKSELRQSLLASHKLNPNPSADHLIIVEWKVGLLLPVNSQGSASICSLRLLPAHVDRSSMHENNRALLCRFYWTEDTHASG